MTMVATPSQRGGYWDTNARAWARSRRLELYTRSISGGPKKIRPELLPPAAADRAWGVRLMEIRQDQIKNLRRQTVHQNGSTPSNGTTQDLGTLGGANSYGYGINASGQVTGNSFVVAGNTQAHAFLYTNGAMQDLGTLGGPTSYGEAINASGQVTGNSQTSESYFHAFLYANGSMQDLGTLGGTSSNGYGINARGQVTGSAATSGDIVEHAFLYTKGHMIDLNSLISSADAKLFTLRIGQAINDKGQIVVNATVRAFGNSVAVLLTPATESPAEKGDVSSRLPSQ
jgi:probable HAF family extracellular repeat protein